MPHPDRAEFQDRSARLLDTSLSAEELTAVRRKERAYLAGLVARAQADPGEDMLGMLVREHGDDLSTDELIGVAGQLLLAGHETTSNMLGLGTLALLRHPDQLAMIREDPARIEPARFPGLALADPYEQVDFRVFSVVFGLNSLRVTW
ncbi:cytochrome P450 [Nonomuraea sp. B5E05]|uniref:cytochrome P450 n=1 Tax=Nonomuraea sp. B5E05 TaxID=3153569 RepID=UPI003261D012